MNIVSVIKKGIGGTGVSHAARYISTRDRDEQREGEEARKLFSADEDKLNYPQANRLLGNGQEPNANELLHVVISLEKQEDFNDLEWTELKLHQAVDASQRLFDRAKAIRQEYQKTGSAIPTPILTRPQLAGLQERAGLNGDVKKYESWKRFVRAWRLKKAGRHAPMEK